VAKPKLCPQGRKRAEPLTTMNVATEGVAQRTAKLAEATIELSDAAPDPKAAPVSSGALKSSPTIDPLNPLVPRYKATAQPVKPSGQVAVFVSRKEKKVF